MYEFWYDYVNPKYGEKATLCYMVADSLIVYIKTENIYVNISKDVKIRFDTSNYEIERSLRKGKNKKETGLRRNELGGKIIKEFVVLRP